MNIDLEKYKKHPRVMEIRFLAFYRMLVKEFGLMGANKQIELICTLGSIDRDKIFGIINQTSNLGKLNSDQKLRQRQELYFMGMCYGDSMRRITKNYFFKEPTNFYGPRKLDLDDFATEDWLEELDSSVMLCGVPAYKTTLEQMLAMVTHYVSIFNRWK